MRRPAIRAVAAIAALAVGALTACQSEPEEPETPQPTVEVAGEVGVRPTITVPPGLSVTESTSDVLVAGDGPVLADGASLLLDYVALDVVTGETVADTFATLPEIRTLTEQSLGEPLYDLLQGTSVGSRLERVELGTPERPNPHVLVVDVLPVQATGTPREPEPGLPTVALEPTGAPVITVPEGEPGSSSRFAVLIKGAGPQVASNQSLVVQLTAVRWSDGAVVDSTWGTEPRAVALAELPTALRAALLEQTVGSQVLVVVPGAEGGTTDALVYVVDVLATADVALGGTEGQSPAGT